MARNQEKAMLLLNRYWAAKKNEGRSTEKRPFLTTECTSLRKAEKWRREVIREVSKKVTQIQNPGLGEFRIRDLNDEINKLLREKRHWEERIIELGGPNYDKFGPKMLDHEGKEVPGNRGYRYFGAARDLPGVRELFEKHPAKPPKKTRGELARNADADYYGYCDEDDGVIVPLEQDQEKIAIAEAVKHWEELKDQGKIVQPPEEEDIYASARIGQPDSDSDDDDQPVRMEVAEDEEGDEKGRVPQVSVPSQREVEEMLIRRKKKELLERYTSDTLQEEVEEAKKLIGYS